MKKVVLSIFIVLFFSSCDKITFDDYFIQNNCDTAISVNIVLWNETINHFTIIAHTDSLIYQTGGIGEHDPPGKTFNSFIITKNGSSFFKNCRDKNNWHYIDVDKTRRKWYLIINPEDFEEAKE
jgi:hypothetical protein